VSEFLSFKNENPTPVRSNAEFCDKISDIFKPFEGNLNAQQKEICECPQCLTLEEAIRVFEAKKTQECMKCNELTTKYSLCAKVIKSSGLCASRPFTEELNSVQEALKETTQEEQQEVDPELLQFAVMNDNSFKRNSFEDIP